MVELHSRGIGGSSGDGRSRQVASAGLTIALQVSDRARARKAVQFKICDSCKVCMINLDVC